jgi:hypothetical protein
MCENANCIYLLLRYHADGVSTNFVSSFAVFMAFGKTKNKFLFNKGGGET